MFKLLDGKMVEFASYIFNKILQIGTLIRLSDPQNPLTVITNQKCLNPFQSFSILSSLETN